MLHEVTTIKLSAGDRLDLSRETAAQVTGHVVRPARIVRNLLDNAVTHEEGRIRAGLSGESGRAVFVIADKGPGFMRQNLSVCSSGLLGSISRDRGEPGVQDSGSRSPFKSREPAGRHPRRERQFPGTTFVVTLPAAHPSLLPITDAILPEIEAAGGIVWASRHSAEV